MPRAHPCRNIAKACSLKLAGLRPARSLLLAMQCAPPRKKPLWWRVLLVIVAAAAGLLLLTRVQLIPPVATKVDLTFAATGLLGVFAVLDGLRWNRLTYPRRMDTWSSSYFCVRVQSGNDSEAGGRIAPVAPARFRLQCSQPAHASFVNERLN